MIDRQKHLKIFNQLYSERTNLDGTYELIARYVMPAFQNLNDNRVDSYNWAKDNHETFMGAAMAAVGDRILKHIEKKGTENISPEILERGAEMMKGDGEAAE